MNSFTTLKDISLPGMRIVFDPNVQPLGVKLFWMSLILTFTSLCVNQLTQRLSYFFEYPVTLSYEVKRLDNLFFPKVTLCPHSDSDDYKMSLSQFRNVSHHEMMTSTMEIVSLFTRCQYSGNIYCNDSKYWVSLMTVVGKCYTLLIKDSFYYLGPTSGIKLVIRNSDEHQTTRDVKANGTSGITSTANPTSQWLLVIHTDMDDAIYGSATSGLPITSGIITSVIYNEKVFVYQNVSTRPCYTDDEVNSCIQHCLDLKYARKLGCRTPYMTTVDLPRCSPDKLITIPSNVYEDASKCKCGKACEEKFYEFQVDTRESVGNNETTTINVFPTREEIEIFREKRAFILYALICEIGGTLGLYMGACLLTFIEIMEWFIGRTYRGLCNPSKAKGLPTERVPIWVMRQAGRYLPEYREVSEQHDFFEICRTPTLACKVTLQPIQRFDLDAAIIFSDILVIPQALGMDVEMKKGIGPFFPKPLQSPEDLKKLPTSVNTSHKLGYVYEAVTLTRKTLDGKVPLIGFSGGPCILMDYMIEGMGSRTVSKSKAWLYRYPEESHELLQLLTNVIVDHLVGQAISGAQMLQVFESHGDHYSPYLFETFALPYIRQIRERVTKKLKENGLDDVPLVIFVKGGHYALGHLAQSGYDVIGLDWTIDPKLARNIVGDNITLQGNLDPCALYAPQESLTKMVDTMIHSFGTDRYIANLGHGIYPDVDPTKLGLFVDTVHRLSKK